MTFVASTGRGPLGTGVHLLWRRTERSGAITAEAFLTLLFLPVVPLGRWRLEAVESSGSEIASAREAASLAIREVARPRVSGLGWLAVGPLAVGLALLPGYAALSWPVGSRFLELGAIFASLALLVGGLGVLDQTRVRVPLRVALRALRGAGRGRGSPDATHAS